VQNNKLHFKLVKDKLKQWIYSLVRDVKAIAKYELSKALLLEWSISMQVEGAVGSTIAETLKSWIIKKILPYVNKTLLLKNGGGRAEDKGGKEGEKGIIQKMEGRGKILIPGF
jgi:hypothetical protein